jgi:hypothetical protein
MKVTFISVLADGSNHAYLKLVPVLMRYYLPGKLVQVKVSEFTSAPGETSSVVDDHILKALDKFNLLDEIITFSDDNTATCSTAAMHRS